MVKIHKSRHLANLYNIVQQTDEPVRAFVARLTGTADMCGMQVQCSDCQQNVSYRDEVVMQMIIHGLANHVIKQRVLSRTGKDKLQTLDELVNYIAAEEISCSESHSVHSDSNTVGHVRQRESAYKKNQGKCNFCGGARQSSSNLLRTDRSFAKPLGKFVRSVESPTISRQSANQAVTAPDKSRRSRPTAPPTLFPPSQLPIFTAVRPLSPPQLQTSLPCGGDEN